MSKQTICDSCGTVITGSGGLSVHQEISTTKFPPAINSQWAFPVGVVITVAPETDDYDLCDQCAWKIVADVKNAPEAAPSNDSTTA